MALVKCKECGGQVSTSAKACPSCGAKPPKSGIGVVGSLVLLGIAVFLYNSVTGGSRSSTPQVVVSDKPSGPHPDASPPPPKPEVAKEIARLRALSDNDFCGKELPKIKKIKGAWPEPWGDAMRSVMRSHSVSSDQLSAIEKGQVHVGMSKCGAIAGWGRPRDVNSTTNARGTREQWVYGGGNYLYFEGNLLTSIQN